MVIEKRKIDCIVPLPKEIRTHIATARAFFGNAKFDKSLLIEDNNKGY